jgi:DHA3 family macrolide efflux protein-like MFS transporter
MSPIGLIIAGPIADKLGVQTWFLIGGIVTLLMGVGCLFIPAVMHFEEGRTNAQQPADKTSSSRFGAAVEMMAGGSTPNPVDVDCT